MGVDDDQLECHLCHPPLTSIAIPGQRIGFEAARVLDQLLIGRKPKLLHRYFSPVRVVSRQSTDTLAIEDEVVATVLKTIHHQAAGGANVDLICQQLDISRRQIERRFRARLGTTVSAEICRVRVELAKQLLTETSLKMPLVAAQSGFSDARRLSVVFKQQTGQGPLAFRRSLHGDSSIE